MLTVSLVNQAGRAFAEQSGQSVSLEYARPYQPGDVIVVTCDAAPAFLTVRLDPALPASTVYLAAGRLVYPVPLEQEQAAYPPTAFTGSSHLISVAPTEPAVLAGRRNLSQNPWDIRGDSQVYPHCTANAETRGEAVFAARNVIDGSLSNRSHGAWPYTSWGDDERADAQIRIDFGRTVAIDEVRLLLRADFPHDNWWTQAELSFSNGDSRLLTLHKSADLQSFPLPSTLASWVSLGKFVRSPQSDSPFPALSEWEVIGTEAVNPSTQTEMTLSENH